MNVLPIRGYTPLRWHGELFRKNSCCREKTKTEGNKIQKDPDERRAFSVSNHVDPCYGPLILEGLLYLRQELLLLTAADLYFRAVAHNDDPAFTPYIFLHMQQVDEKRFVHT